MQQKAQQQLQQVQAQRAQHAQHTQQQQDEVKCNTREQGDERQRRELEARSEAKRTAEKERQPLLY